MSINSHAEVPIPTTQKAFIFETPGGPLIYKTDYPVPVPKPNEILVNVKYSGSKNVVQDIINLTDGGAHAALNLSVSEREVTEACSYVKRKGVVVMVGLPVNARVDVSMADAVRRAIQIKGSYPANRTKTAEPIEFFVRGLVKTPIKIVGLSELGNVYDLLEQGKVAGRFVVSTDK